MRLSPRERRLHSDYRAIQELRDESSIISFESQGVPPDHYRVVFLGRGVARNNQNEVIYADRHEIIIRLTSGYPRSMPELTWQTPVFHPNISAGGIVCLGGYGTHWVPSLRLDELCNMLWDMIRYKNFDVESPYNRDAAMWARAVAGQQPFPMDRRPLRNRIEDGSVLHKSRPPVVQPDDEFVGVQFIDAELIEPNQHQAQRLGPIDDDIVFID
jgi:ubiquitin-protein ligase